MKEAQSPAALPHIWPLRCRDAAPRRACVLTFHMLPAGGGVETLFGAGAHFAIAQADRVLSAALGAA